MLDQVDRERRADQRKHPDLHHEVLDQELLDGRA
jgi:hypothetical protein